MKANEEVRTSKSFNNGIKVKERQKLTKIEKGIMYVLASTGLLISVIIKMWK